ncbi:30S ribosomal protein S15 [Candidatus Peribacteria bacterium]|nr:30S ribosomal protein S15 [Candidatus Peribacteria bacterium]
MTLDSGASKKDVITQYQTHKKDTGSTPVQVAVLTQRIASLTEHLKENHKDQHSRRGLIGLVGKRRKLLRYMEMHDPKAHAALVKELGLRK